jgi:hypothetical protein
LEATICHFKKCKWRIYYRESEDENCGILCEENEDEDLEDFDQCNEYNFKELNRFPEVDNFALIRLWINGN